MNGLIVSSCTFFETTLFFAVTLYNHLELVQCFRIIKFCDFPAHPDKNYFPTASLSTNYILVADKISQGEKNAGLRIFAVEISKYTFETQIKSPKISR